MAEQDRPTEPTDVPTQTTHASTGSGNARATAERGHPKPVKRKPPPYGKQLLFSLLAAVLITIVTIAAVTAAIGPGPDWEELYDTRSERRDLIDERQDAREEREEERQEQLEQDQDASGSG